MKKKVLFSFLLQILCSGFYINLFAQGCNGAVSASVNPKEYCFEGNPIQVTLNGSVIGQSCKIFWTPEDNLDNPNILRPTATITAPGMYMYTLHAIIKNSISGNLIVNGGFESGNTAFSSDYSYVDPTPNSLWTEGNYTVLNPGQTPKSVHDNFSTCAPHGGSRFMVANGNAAFNTKVWCQSVSVAANTGYLLSAWATSVHPASPAILQFSINGDNIGNPLTLSAATCNWQNFFECWFSETATIAEVCIVNLNTALSGNDFGVDDISLTKAQVDSCKVSFKVVEPVRKNKAVSICKGDKYTLGTSTFEETGYYQDIHVKGPGPCDTIYDLDLTVIEMTSAIIDTVGLSCFQPTLKLTGEVILSNNLYQNLTYFWTAFNGGNVVSGGTTLTPTINKGGKYLLTTTYKSGGLTCRDTVSIQIVNDTIKPKVTIVPDLDTLNCFKSTITLNATVNTNGNPYSINWKTLQNGHIISGDTTLAPLIDSTGLYILTIKNLKNGCIGLDTSFIKKDKAIPLVDINLPDTLSCSKDSVRLFTMLQDYTKYRYHWTTQNGLLDNNTMQYDAWAKGPGNYQLVVENVYNKCKDSIAVEVLSDKNVPVAFIEPPNYLNCVTKQILLDGSKSSSGVGITHSWTTLNGSFISGDTTLKPTVNKNGVYQLTIVNTVNGCVKNYSVDVKWDTAKPTVSILPPDELSCITTSVEISGNGDANGNPIYYQWTTLDGQIIGIDTLSKVTAAKTGNYILTITNRINGCKEALSVEVKNDTIKPIAIIDVADTLNCSVNQISVIADKSSKGGRYVYSWKALLGNIQNGSNTLQPVVNQPGMYQLIVQDTILGCKDSAQIAVYQNINKPKAVIDPPNILTCKDTVVFINGYNSAAQSGQLYYVWKSEKNGLLSDTSSKININDEDKITLTVKDKNNGCLDTTQVSILKNTIPPVATIDTALELTCKNPVLTIGSKIIKNQGVISYNWFTTDGTIIGGNQGASIEVSKDGTYYLEIEDAANHCRNLLSTKVSKNVVLPIVSILQPGILNCRDTLLKLDGNASSSGQQFMYLWKTANGNLLSGTTSAENATKVPGDYTLVVTNTQTGCVDSAVVTVQQDILKPNVTFAPPTEINCIQKVIQVDGSASSSGGNFVYNWSTNKGNIIGSTSSNSINVDEPGFYILEVTNNGNHCRSIDSVYVNKSADVPIASILKPDTLNCARTTISIDGSLSSLGGVFSLQWTAGNGGIIQGNPQNATITTIQPGTYTLVVTNTTNNCKDTSSVQVFQDIKKPNVVATVSDTINCRRSQIQLDGGLSSATQIQYNWFTQNGTIVSGANGATPSVSKAGQYHLEITDQKNFCKDTTTITVLDNFVKPVFTIISTDTLSCKKNAAVISTTSNPNYSFQWTGGAIQSGQSTNSIQVTQSANYKLVVVHNQSGCKDSSTIFVPEDFIKPFIKIQSPQKLTCKNKTISIDGSGSSSGIIYTYLWTTANGVIVGGNNAPLAEVARSGTYKLLIINTENGCQSEQNVTVQEDTISPVFAVVPPKEITCVQKTAVVAVNSNGIYTYQWTTANGNILGSTSGSSILTDKKGQYEVTVTNPTNGCAKSATVPVNDYIVYPNADAGEDLMMNCKTNKAILSGMEANDVSYTYFWKTLQGSTLGYTKSITVANTGTYIYSVKNINNGSVKN